MLKKFINSILFNHRSKETTTARLLKMTDNTTVEGNQAEVADHAIIKPNNPRSKIKNKKFCLLVSYCGQNYMGMQRNPGAKTVEDELFKGMLAAQVINRQQYVSPRDILFQRAARTDKHVSALKQICSLKVLETITEKLDDINKYLPDDIRVMACKRTTQGFDAKNFCDSRTYSYTMPTFALADISQNPPPKDYRASQETLAKFRNVIDHFKGVHRFHNYTSGKSAKEASSTRVIKTIGCSDPFYPCDQKVIEFVIVRIRGQSFMLHQIRKMIGVAIAVMRGFVTLDELKHTMDPEPQFLPRAPGVNLMLEEPHFDTYNRQFARNGNHEPIEWNQVNSKLVEFKEKYILPVIVDAELKNDSMMEWLKTLDFHYSKETQDDMTNQREQLQSHNG